MWVRVKAVFHSISRVPPWALNCFFKLCSCCCQNQALRTQSMLEKKPNVAFEDSLIRSLNFINYTSLDTKTAKFLCCSKQKPHSGTTSCPLFMGQIQLETNDSIVFHWYSHITEGLSASVRSGSLIRSQY